MVIQKRKGFGPRTGILKYCQVDCPQMKSTDEVNDMFEKILKNWFLNSVRLIHRRAQDKQLSSVMSDQCREQVWYNIQPSAQISQTLINFYQSQSSYNSLYLGSYPALEDCSFPYFFLEPRSLLKDFFSTSLFYPLSSIRYFLPSFPHWLAFSTGAW